MIDFLERDMQPSHFRPLSQFHTAEQDSLHKSRLIWSSGAERIVADTHARQTNLNPDQPNAAFFIGE